MRHHERKHHIIGTEAFEGEVNELWMAHQAELEGHPEGLVRI